VSELYEYLALPGHYRQVFWRDLGCVLGRSRELARRGAKTTDYMTRDEPGRLFSRPFEGDVLLEIEPVVYVEKLADVEVPRRGIISCPFPGHDDHHPSFKVYREPERGVWCFACNRGGSIYDFAAALWGYETRGKPFKELRSRLAKELLS